jgi:hypothetical protein
LINKKYHTVRTVPKSNRKIVKRYKIDILSTYTHDCPLSWLGTGTSMKGDRVKLVYEPKPP